MIEATASVGTIVDPETGEVVVVVRFGPTTAMMTPADAATLADALAVEAAYALALTTAKPSPNDPGLLR